MKKRKTLIIVVIFVLICGAAILRAQFGFSIVYDPQNTVQTALVVAKEITNGATLVSQLQQLYQTYQTIVQDYNLAKQMATQFANKNYWKTLMFQVGNELIRNHYGESINLATVMNGNYAQAAAAWIQATYSAPSSNFMGNVTAQNSRRMSEYATVQLMDQTSTRCAQILAQYESTQAANQAAIVQLQTDTLDTSSAANTAIAVGNMQNGASEQGIAIAQAAGNLEACIAEQQTLQAKLERDRLAANTAWYSDVATSRATTPSQLDPTTTANLMAGGYLVP
jgi:hypothetical protein